MRSWPDLRLKQDISIYHGEGRLDFLHVEVKIEQLAESETHTCLRMNVGTTCVMNAGLGKDAETGAIHSRYDSEWLKAIGRDEKLADLCNGDFYSCGIYDSTDRRLACWASSTVCDSGLCAPPAADGGFARVSCGIYHACAVTARDGRVLCWGSNTDGEAQPPAGAFKSISAGARHTCGVRVDGTVECWGSNKGVGEFEGTLTWQASPPPVRMQAVAAGEMHSCGIVAHDPIALTAPQPPPPGGCIVCWGDNSRLQSSPPLMRVVAIFAGSLHSCAVTAAASLLVCWGDKSISPRFDAGQRGAANPPEDLTICAQQLRRYEVHHLGFRAISESFLHNVVDGASLVLLPSHVSPYSAPYLMLTPAYLVVNRNSRSPAHLAVSVYRNPPTPQQAQQTHERHSGAAHADSSAQLVCVCYFGYVFGRVAGGAPVLMQAGGVGVAHVKIVTQHLAEGPHNVECVLAKASAAGEEGGGGGGGGGGANRVGGEDQQRYGLEESHELASLGGCGTLYVSATTPTLSILSPSFGAILPLPCTDNTDEWGVGDDDFQAEADEGRAEEEWAGEKEKEDARVVLVAVELELKAESFEGWGASARVRVCADGQIVSIISGPAPLVDTSADALDEQDGGGGGGGRGVLHVRSSITVPVRVMRRQQRVSSVLVKVDMVDDMGTCIAGASASVTLLFQHGEERVNGDGGGSDGAGSEPGGRDDKRGVGSGLGSGKASASKCKGLIDSRIVANSGGKPRLCTLPIQRRRQSLLLSRVSSSSFSAASPGTDINSHHTVHAHTPPRCCRRCGGGVGGFWHIMTLASDWAQQTQDALQFFETLPAAHAARSLTLSLPFSFSFLHFLSLALSLSLHSLSRTLSFSFLSLSCTHSLLLRLTV